MAIVIAAVLVLGAGVFYAAMVVSGKQDDTCLDEIASRGQVPAKHDGYTETLSAEQLT